MKLDDKLREMISRELEWSIANGGATVRPGKLIAQIKQAFVDDPHWAELVTTSEQDGTNVHYKVFYSTDGKTSVSKTERMLTGQEFYDRFEKELDKKVQGVGYSSLAERDNEDIDWILEAAKKAAGL